MLRRIFVSGGVVFFLILGMFSLAWAAPIPSSQLIPVAASPDDEMLPAVAYSTVSGTYLVAYQYHDGSDYHVALRMFDSHGTPLFPGPMDLGAGHRFPAVAYNSLHDLFGVATARDDAHIVMHWIPGNDQALAPGSTGQIVQTSSDTVMAPAIAFNDTAAHADFLIVWEEGVLGDWSVYGHRVTPTAPFHSVGPLIPIALTTRTPTYEENYSAPDVAYNSDTDEYLVVFEHWTNDPAHSTASDILGRRIRNDGTGPAPLPHLVIDAWPCDQFQPTVAAFPLNPAKPYFVAYEDKANPPGCDTEVNIRGIYLQADGNLAIPANYLNLSATLATREANPDLIASDLLGAYIITWSKYSGANSDIYARRIDPDLGLLDQPTLISGGVPNVRGNETYPVVGGGWPTTFIVWHEDGWGGGPMDVVGRIWGYLVHLPLVVK